MITITSTFTADLIKEPLTFFLKLTQQAVTKINMTPYAQVSQQLLDPNSLLCQNKQGFNIILIRLEDWLPSLIKPLSSIDSFFINSLSAAIEKRVDKFLLILRNQANEIQAPLIIGLCSFAPIVYNNPDLLQIFKKLERKFQDFIEHLVGVYLLTTEEINTYYPVKNYYDEHTNKLGHIPYTEEYFSALAAMLVRKIHAIEYAPYKVMAFDCDNTLWQGICGEEEVEHLIVTETQRAFQQFIIQQQQIGVLICLCSKNNESDVWKVFDQNPNMLLKRKHIADYRINWQEKSLNINDMALNLKLSLQDFIFIDDNTSECARIQQVHPEVLTIQYTSNILHVLQHIWGLDKLHVSREDQQRTISYQKKFTQSVPATHNALGRFLEALQLEVTLSPLTISSLDTELKRAAELTRKTNQFNCTTQRFTDKQLQQLLRGPETCLIIHIKDVEKNYGIKGVIIFEIKEECLVVSTFLLSCEVLGRGAEHCILAELAGIAQEKNINLIKILFLPSTRNEPAENFLKSVYGIACETSDQQIIFTISSEQARHIKHEAIQSLASNPGPRKIKRDFNLTEVEKNEDFKIDYLRIAKEFSTVEQILTQLKLENYQTRPISIAGKKPENLLEQELVNLWEETLGILSIDSNDNFSQLGGDSIKATLLLAKLYYVYEIELQISDLLSSTISELAILISNREKDKIYFKQIALTSEERQQLLPLSFAQQRLWFLEQLEPNSALYNMFVAFELKGTLKQDALKQAFLILLERHESLRTRFIIQKGQVYQSISPYSPELLKFSWDIEAGLPKDALNELAHSESQQPFQFSNTSLLRIRVLECALDRHILMICMPHIIHDGWSFHIFCRELAQAYSALVERKQVTLSEKHWDYVDFSQWQQQLLNSTQQENLLAYWTKQLAEFSPLNFPSDYSKSNLNRNYRGERIPFEINTQVLSDVKKISQTNQATLFTTLFSVFSILVGHYSGQDDLLIGTPISGRHYPNLENIIGFFINILILRADMSGNPCFIDFLQRNKEMILNAYRHQDLPFEKLVSALNPERVTGKNPLANIMFNFQSYPVTPLNLAGLSCQRVFSDNESLLLSDYESAKVDLSFYMQETSDGLKGLIEYNPQLFHRDTIERFIAQFQTLLVSIVAAPEAPILQLSLLSQQEKIKMLSGLGTHKKNYPIDQPLCTLLQKQVEKTPNNIALSLANEALSYQQLNERANQLAHYLVSLGVKHKQVIGIYLERSFELIISLLAIWKTGNTPVFIDANYPRQRVNFIVKDCQPTILISQDKLYSELQTKLNQSNNEANIAYLLDLNQVQSYLFQQSKQNLEVTTSLDEVLYIIYTSGSTGVPKGVLIQQQGAINMAYAQIDELGICVSDCILQFARFTFDAFFWELLGAWLAGARLCLPPADIKLIGNDLLSVLKTESISIATLTPSVVETISIDEMLPNLRLLVLAGEAPSIAIAEKWSQYCQVINAYGPSEASVCASIEKIDLSTHKLTIGTPIANVEIFILDAYLQPAPINVPGKIYIGGIGLAKAYLNSEELTQASFIKVLFNGKSKRIYKTGDCGRWLSDGRIEYLGRANNSQVKLRGFRIELDEVKQQIVNHTNISNAVIVVQDQHLTAYLVTKPDVFVAGSSYFSLAEEQVQQWQALYEDLYQKMDADKPLDFNCLGWNSSYTGKPFLEEEMQEWIEGTVHRILALRPKRVLEIGCGAGLLMTRIAPHCDLYVATDFSAAAIDYLQKLTNNLNLQDKIHLIQRPAGYFDEQDQIGYDVIIINSVIQYFPDIDHLIRVIERSIVYTQAGGKIFIGDVRSLVHLETLHSAILLRSMSNTTTKEWKITLSEKLEREEELVIDAIFFDKYAKKNPLLNCAITQLRRGKYINELTQFRYDVILYKKGPVSIPDLDVNWHQWGKEFDTQKIIGDFLLNQSPDYLALRAIPNKRVLTAISALAPENSLNSLAEDPEVLALIAEKLGYHLIINWSKQDPLHCFDAVFFHGPDLTHIIDPSFCKNDLLKSEDWSDYANQPQKAKIKQMILVDLIRQIKENLADYMIPANWYFIKEIPLTAHGKTNYKALQGIYTPKVNRLLELPKTDIEKKLSLVWKTILNIDSIGINDNFFEVGGESLRAVYLIAEINKLFFVELPVKAIWDAPTVKQLCVMIEEYQLKQTPYQLKNSIILLKKDKNGLPLFLIHPVGGTVFCYKSLVQYLNYTGSCYAIQDPSIEAKNLIFSSIESMAKIYIDLIKEFQAHGPYRIAGHSFGGTVAVEIAKELTKMGEKVQFVALMDTWANANNTSEVHEYVKQGLIKQYEKNKLTEYSARLFKHSVISLNDWIKLGADRMRLALNYKPPDNFEVPLILFKAKESSGKTLSNQESTTNYWDRYSYNLKVHQISGNHESMLEYPNVEKIASIFNFYLDEAYENACSLQQQTELNDITVTKISMNY